MMEKRIGKRDLILLCVVLAAALALWGGYRLMHRGEGAKVRITVDGETYGTYELKGDAQTIPIKIAGTVTNTLVIQDGKADMTQAICPDLLCVHQKAISAPGETIVCLPHKIVVEVIGGEEETEFDSIAK